MPSAIPQSESLWFRYEGETDEGDHIATMGPTAEREIDFRNVYGTDTELTRKEIITRCQPMGYDERTIDRLLRKAKESGKLRMQKYGVYSLLIEVV